MSTASAADTVLVNDKSISPSDINGKGDFFREGKFFVNSFILFQVLSFIEHSHEDTF